MIGEECDLLGLVSPHTYIVRKKTLAYCIKISDFFKEMLNLNPLGLKELKDLASQKLHQFTQLCRDKREWDKEVSQVKSIKLANEKQSKMTTAVRKRYPIGDKPLIENIVKSFQN